MGGIGASERSIAATLTSYVESHPFADGEGSAEHFVRDLLMVLGMDAKAPVYEPTLEEIMQEQKALAAPSQYSERTHTLEGEELDQKISTSIAYGQRRMVRLLALQEMRAVSAVRPTWWRDALARFKGSE